MVVTLGGMVISRRAVFRKALVFSSFTLEGISTDWRATQSWKQSMGISVRLADRWID